MCPPHRRPWPVCGLPDATTREVKRETVEELTELHPASEVTVHAGPHETTFSILEQP